jgi:hypothetical protein
LCGDAPGQFPNHSVSSSSEIHSVNTENAHIRSFIIKIYLDELSDQSNGVLIRGYVTPVPNGKRRTSFEGFEGLAKIPEVIASYLPGIEHKQPARSRASTAKRHRNQHK